MRVAVVTPYFKEPLEKLKRCHDSVANQTVKTDHYLVADGFPKPEVNAWNAVHIPLPVNHNDYGDTPRLIGTASAVTKGYDAILLLDGDNWFEPNHVETMLAVQNHFKADVVTCPRMLRRPDGSVLGQCKESDGVNFNDTNCFLLTKPVFPIFRAWGFKDPKLGIVGDRLFWNAIRDNAVSVARSDLPTVNYETTFACHYEERGETPPENGKVIARFTDGSYKMMNWRDYQALMQQQVQVTRPPQ